MQAQHRIPDPLVGVVREIERRRRTLVTAISLISVVWIGGFLLAACCIRSLLAHRVGAVTVGTLWGLTILLLVLALVWTYIRRSASIDALIDAADARTAR